MVAKWAIVGVVLAANMQIAGCARNPPSSSAAPQAAASSSPPVAQPAFTSWQQGDKEAALSKFLAADWSARPLFISGSTLSLTETQFQKLPDDDREAKLRDALKQIGPLKELGRAIAEAGRDAAAKGDADQARKYFLALKQCGAALESPDCLLLVQGLGKSFQRMAQRGFHPQPSWKGKA